MTPVRKTSQRLLSVLVSQHIAASSRCWGLTLHLTVPLPVHTGNPSKSAFVKIQFTSTATFVAKFFGGGAVRESSRERQHAPWPCVIARMSQPLSNLLT